jgi:methyl-accepting chemotaxis protein
MRNFEREVILKSFLPDFVAAIVIFAYTFFSVRVDYSRLKSLLKIFVVVFVFCQFTFALLTDHLCYHKISERVKNFYKIKSTTGERTHLFEEIMRFPFYTAGMTAFYFFAGVLLLVLYMFYSLHLKIDTCLLFFIEGMFGVYFSFVVGFNICNSVVSSIAGDIIKAGIEKQYVMEKKIFGVKINAQILLYVVLPFLITCFINCAIVFIGIYFEGSVLSKDFRDLQIESMSYTCILNALILFISILFFYFDVNSKNDKMSAALTEMNETGFSKINQIDTDLSDEFAYNHFLANQLIAMFRGILFQTSEFAKTINKSIYDLVRISNEAESTSVEQSAGIKEIVSTMENITKLSHNIENRINEVADIARETFEKVNSGSELLDKSLDSITTIADANEVTISGIKNLNDKINSIWEIANIIDNVSDQIKIIAFNAELEAVTATGEDKNFKNVSTEIRRLANSTIDSTREIKERINSIQESSASLIKVSEENTGLIKHETELAVGLGDKFTNISNSTKANSSSANEIKYLIEQQTKAFDQIVNTLHQISSSIQDISVSTKTLIETSRSLQENVNQIESINVSVAQEEENE